MPKRMRTAARASSSRAATLVPSTAMRPASGRSRPHMSLRRTVLPEAPGPMSPQREPFGMARSMPSRRRAPAKLLVTPSKRIMPAGILPAIEPGAQRRSALELVLGVGEALVEVGQGAAGPAGVAGGGEGVGQLPEGVVAEDRVRVLLGQL